MDLLRALDTLAAYYVKRANQERDKYNKRQNLAKASELYNTGDKICMYEANHLTGKAYLCLSQGNWDQAKALFELALKEMPNNIPALLGIRPV